MSDRVYLKLWLFSWWIPCEPSEVICGLLRIWKEIINSAAGIRPINASNQLTQRQTLSSLLTPGNQPKLNFDFLFGSNPNHIQINFDSSKTCKCRPSLPFYPLKFPTSSHPNASSDDQHSIHLFDPSKISSDFTAFWARKVWCSTSVLANEGAGTLTISITSIMHRQMEYCCRPIIWNPHNQQSWRGCHRGKVS